MRSLSWTVMDEEWIGSRFCLVKPAHDVEVAGQGGRRSWIVEVRLWEDVVVSGRRGRSGRKRPNVHRGRVRVAALFLTVSPPHEGDNTSRHYKRRQH